MFFQHENRFRYKFFDIVQFSRSCAPQPYRLTACLFYHFRDKLSSTFLKIFRSSCRTFLFLRVWTFVLKCFILSDVRLTVTYFSTGSGKKQDFFQYFLRKILLLTFCPVFSFTFDISALILPKDVCAAELKSYAPAGRSVPGWYAAPLRSRSGYGCRRTAAGSADGPAPGARGAPLPD